MTGLNTHSDILPITPLKFTGCQKVRTLASIFESNRHSLEKGNVSEISNKFSNRRWIFHFVRKFVEISSASLKMWWQFRAFPLKNGARKNAESLSLQPHTNVYQRLGPDATTGGVASSCNASQLPPSLVKALVYLDFPRHLGSTWTWH